MPTPHDFQKTLQEYFSSRKVATLARLKTLLSTSGTMTVFRRLRELGYLTSYSHRGKYYTLLDIPAFDAQGLWSFESVRFSQHGTLVQTVKRFVHLGESGWTAGELESVLQVEVKHTLLHLVREGEIGREEIAGVYIYLSLDRGKRRAQVLLRRGQQEAQKLGLGGPPPTALPELKAAVILFFSLLDEKQRRLYAGLEAQKLGHGGDHTIAQMLGLDAHTVGRGRRELFGGEVDGDRIRKKGGGRMPLEKKRPQ